MRKYVYAFGLLLLMLGSGFILINPDNVDETVFHVQSDSSEEKIFKPKLSLTANDESIHFRRGSYCWRNTCEDNKDPFRSVKLNELPGGSTIDLVFDGVQPNSLSIIQGDSEKLENVTSLEEKLSVPIEKGTYYYQIKGRWNELGEIYYYTIIEVY
ncbi:hypothetical protein [Bacillus suaedaesalsae]|uniref:Peptidase C-terminal archaeal/bacterial domain-containing protein n=1 Tax=Bacillus suaedaesalsae TaxID=2810349 RepID=A0ABS2DM33_9BACI|nr:hypothetical protein [Bacillus suaedaesalsae]MBM6619552.1 hypothetical protein [Bacillus suaedaesalsae]